jgi:hypothetical protein
VIPKMKALDLFCGLGGWSDGLDLEGFDVLGVEIEEKIAKLYKHKVICADVTTLNPEDFKGYDLIVGSPPCREFTPMGDCWGKRWKRPPEPEKGLELIKWMMDFIEKAKPTFWLLENNPRAEKYLRIKPRQVTPLSKGMRRAFWGNFPSFLVPRDYGKTNIQYYKGPNRAWERARIPMPVARALGAAVRDKIEQPS